MGSSNRLIWMFAWLIVDVKAYTRGCSGGYCFVLSDFDYINEHSNQSSAQERCRSFGAQLVEVRDRDIQNSVMNFISNEIGQQYDGGRFLTNGKRSSGNWVHLSGNEVTGLIVYEQRDAFYAYGYLKSSFYGFDLFASRPADSKGGFICTGSWDCSGGVTISGQCYKSFTETLSWFEARNRCLDGGGDLASFDHITTNAGFNALNGSWINTRNSYWIGIRRESWTWESSNSDVRYSDWIIGHPLNEISLSDTDCLCLSTTEGKWIEWVCNHLSPFVCISENGSTTFRTTSTTTFTTTRSTRSSSGSTTSASTDKITASSMASESNGVSTPTIPATVTSKSTGNDTGVMELSMGLSREAILGIGVGVGVGGALVITASIIAVIILCRKRSPLRQAPPTQETTSAKNPIGQPVGGDLQQERNGVAEDPYESLQPRIERTATSDGLYQSLDHSKKTDVNVLYSNIRQCSEHN